MSCFDSNADYIFYYTVWVLTTYLSLISLDGDLLLRRYCITGVFSSRFVVSASLAESASIKISVLWIISFLRVVVAYNYSDYYKISVNDPGIPY